MGLDPLACLLLHFFLLVQNWHGFRCYKLCIASWRLSCLSNYSSSPLTAHSSLSSAHWSWCPSEPILFPHVVINICLMWKSSVDIFAQKKRVTEVSCIYKIEFQADEQKSHKNEYTVSWNQSRMHISIFYSQLCLAMLKKKKIVDFFSLAVVEVS